MTVNFARNSRNRADDDPENDATKQNEFLHLLTEYSRANSNPNFQFARPLNDARFPRRYFAEKNAAKSRASGQTA